MEQLTQYNDRLIMLDKLIDEENEIGFERVIEMSAYESVEEYRVDQRMSSVVLNAATTLRDALILQHRIDVVNVTNAIDNLPDES